MKPGWRFFSTQVNAREFGGRLKPLGSGDPEIPPKMAEGLALVWDALLDSVFGFGCFWVGRGTAFFDSSIPGAQWSGGFSEGSLAA